MKPSQTELAVAERSPTQLAKLPSINIENLIAKAVDSKAAVDVVKELRMMLREDQEIAAKQAFDQAMSDFQSGCPVIVKSRGVPDRSGATAYRYAPIEYIEEVIRPIEKECGFTHTFNQDVTSQPGWVVAKCTVVHTLGHSRETLGKFPLGTKTGIMSDTQVYASALTFANRRVLGNAYGLVFVGEDRDGADRTRAGVTAKVATEKTREWFLNETRDIHIKLQAYAIDRAIIMPDEGLDSWPLDAVPTSKAELNALRKEVEAHDEKKRIPKLPDRRY